MSNIVASFNRQQGNAIILKTSPTVGLLALTSFIDDAASTDPSSNSQFVKTFRYTTNGVIYSEWLLLTIENIVAIEFDDKSVFVAELSYFKNEPTGTNYLTITEATIGISSATMTEGYYFSNSIFAKYFKSTDPNVLDWYINVLEKLYNKGLVPNFVQRQDQTGSIEDYLALWGSIAKFCAFYVAYARVFGEFYNYNDLIEDYLNERGLNTSPQDSLEDWQVMMETYYFQMSKRGTHRIILDKVNDDADVDGELLRLIFFQEGDEFIFHQYAKDKFGWTLDKSSPLYRGLRQNQNLNKAPWSEGYVSMKNATPYLTNATISMDKSTITMGSGGGGLEVQTAGLIKVSPDLDYQISFFIELGAGKTFTLACNGYDSDGNSVTLNSRKNNNPITNFFSGAVMSRSDKFIQVRAYLYNSQRGVYAGDTTNIKQGQNLLLTNAVASIGFDLTTNGTAQIKGFQIVPMNTEYSRGFLQVDNFISCWCFNRNNKYDIKQLQAYINRYLVDIDSQVKVTNIGDYIYTTPEVEPDTTYWVGAGEYCRKVEWVGSDPSCQIQNTAWIPDESSAYCEQTS